MVNYRVRRVFNLMLRSDRSGRRDVSLARLALVEDSNNDIHAILICPKDGGSIPGPETDPEAYLRDNLARMVTSS